MPWCPKCRNEYVEGITRCADCGSELVDSLNEVESETLICADAEKIHEMRRFFLANGLKDCLLDTSFLPAGISEASPRPGSVRI